ncbi:MAG: hypothetical protein K6E63_06140 [Lachnospiraceae bacterium]|nr:hypothetical protein [Lachnospiraceae bacterium]
MKDLLGSIINAYENYRGTGKLLALFLVSVLIICLYNSGHSDKKVNPAWFILCPVAGIAYAFTLVYETYIEKQEKSVFRALGCLFVFLALALSGRLTFAVAGNPGVLSVVLTVLFLVIYGILACRLFSEKKSRIFMILCILALALFSYQSDALLPVTMFGHMTLLPSLIVHGLLPFILWFAAGSCGIYLKDTADAGGTYEDDYYLWEEEDMKNHKFINARTVAAALLVVVIMLIASVFVMNRKINSLYETTVNLQQQVNELQNSGNN